MPVDLAYESYGSGPPLVVVHGLLGSKRNWAHIAKRLGAHHRVLAADLRNHGDSPWTETMGFEEMAADLARLLDREGLDQAAVMAHSLGGKVAMTLALSEPDRVERLVVVDVAPVAYSASFLSYIEAMQAVDLSGIERRSEADRALAGRVRAAGVRGFLLQNLEVGKGGARWKPNLEGLVRAMDTMVEFTETAAGRRFEGPALFVRGERSDYVRPEHREAIERLFPKALVVTVKGAGHWVHAERPEPFLATVKPFLVATQEEAAAGRPSATSA